MCKIELHSYIITFLQYYSFTLLHSHSIRASEKTGLAISLSELEYQGVIGEIGEGLIVPILWLEAYTPIGCQSINCRSINCQALNSGIYTQAPTAKAVARV